MRSALYLGITAMAWWAVPIGAQATPSMPTSPAVWVELAEAVGDAMGSLAKGLSTAYCSVLTVGDTRAARQERAQLNDLSARLSRVASAGTLAGDEIAIFLERPDSAQWSRAVRSRLVRLASDLDSLQRDLQALNSPFVGENPAVYARLMTGVGRRSGAIADLQNITPPAQPRASQLQTIRAIRGRLMLAVAQVEAANVELSRYISARFVQKKGCPSGRDDGNP